ncbi:MAG: class I SAM-dependent methyltransferase [Candidatus Pacebacteria bacterium]|nr:class I SAM-dependent methyltransferase [Candidatus Paceibacterota bacterium]
MNQASPMEIPANRDPLVRRVFDSVAANYDLMNDIMSLGVHRLWKQAMVTYLLPQAGQTILDVAGGTGDISYRILQQSPDSRIISLDINQAMLTVGRDRAIDSGLDDRIDHLVGTAESLPLNDSSVHAYTIAFGLRNVSQRTKALSEARRVLKPGGKFICLEFNHIESASLDTVYQQWSRMIPQFGEWIAKDRLAYEYLVESIRRFPKQSELASEIEAAGLGRVGWRNYSFGIVALHYGVRL